MKAKLKVLCALTHKAKFLLLDEPTAGLDVMARESILNLFREYMEEDGERTILISSHISSDLEGLCDDIYMIHEGRIIFHEDTDVLLNQYGLLKVDEKQFEELDKRYLLKKRKEHYGYACLTKEKQYYIENYPDIVVEKGTVDELIAMMIGGNELLIKDLKLMKNNGKNLLLVFLIIGTMMGIMTKELYAAVGYVTFIFTLFTVSTISYDEYDNGYPFLLLCRLQEDSM